MKEFKSIPSKLYKQTEEWVANEKNITQAAYSQNRPHTTTTTTKRPSSACRPSTTNMNVQVDKASNLGMFEKYYYDKLREKNRELGYDENKDDDLFINHNNDPTEEELYMERLQHKEKQMQNIQNIEDKLNEQYESIKKAKLKEATPRSNEIGMLLPKTPKNYVKENKHIVSMKTKEKGCNDDKEENVFHKNYGKTPKYIVERKIENEIKKEIIKKRKEQAKYPKGTRLLSEEERVATLNGLIESKKEVINELEKLPITMRTMAAKNRKDELERKLDEIEEAIKMFSRKQVFIKVDE